MAMSVQIPTFAEKLLERVAKREGKAPEDWASRAILEMLEDAEDAYTAEKILKQGGKRYTQKEIEEEFGLDHSMDRTRTKKSASA